jgi:hypothetical protein
MKLLTNVDENHLFEALAEIDPASTGVHGEMTPASDR